MFGLSSIARRCTPVACDGTFKKVFRPIFRCFLRIALFPGVPSLVLLYVLYTIAEHEFTERYFALDSVWRPAFPWSWRILLLSLFVVPAFSFLHVLWLLISARQWWRWRYSLRSSPSQGYIMLPRSESNSLDEREPSSARDDESRELAGTEGEGGSSRTQLRFHHPLPRYHLSSSWCLQFIFWFLASCTSLGVGLHYRQPAALRYLPLINNANAHPDRAGHGNRERIFIAAMFYNNEQVVPYWSDSLVKAIRYLGEDNVFVSILESGSEDQTPTLLQQLDARLDTMNVSRRILTQDEAVTKPEDVSGQKRISFLSALRNRALEPLVEKGGYDKVIFSNDIFIEPETIIELLNTADGEYDMACGMDFGHFGLYDMWVLRDKRGRLGSTIWPYFFDAEDYEAMRSESPVPVFTCWNGIVVFRADPVLPIHLRSNHTLSTDPLPFELPVTHPAAHDPSLRGPSPALTPPISFRASAPGECFSSESFLFPYDLRRVFHMQRILVNPRVIVAYDWRYVCFLFVGASFVLFLDRLVFYVYFKWFMGHPVLRWWIEKVYDGAWMQKDVMVVGDPKQVWHWDGGDCHPWW